MGRRIKSSESLLPGERHWLVMGSNSSLSLGQMHRKLPSTFSHRAPPHSAKLISHSFTSEKDGTDGRDQSHTHMLQNDALGSRQGEMCCSQKREHIAVIEFDETVAHQHICSCPPAGWRSLGHTGSGRSRPCSRRSRGCHRWFR